MGVVKDMAITEAAFLRDLPRAMNGLEFHVEGSRVIAGGPEHGLTIDLKPLPARKLSGLLSLSRTEVTIDFHGFSPTEETDFLEQFYRAYQRGGG